MYRLPYEKTNSIIFYNLVKYSCYSSISSFDNWGINVKKLLPKLFNMNNRTRDVDDNKD